MKDLIDYELRKKNELINYRRADQQITIPAGGPCFNIEAYHSHLGSRGPLVGLTK